ncbi:hypothetical protein F2Q70_00026344 [Brassica cretica]|uniref:Uncharacterized protein n=1 Tax=Brassica cretica TaxID=69181 RepID=A0A8S9L6C4_BRACR|nr:hypothetical protein F2Q68_00025903 [Brassica cretica]KAF2602914.1 hypothetical protein F2Q70_00026344 [Brassica cretica]
MLVAPLPLHLQAHHPGYPQNFVFFRIVFKLLSFLAAFTPKKSDGKESEGKVIWCKTLELESEKISLPSKVPKAAWKDVKLVCVDLPSQESSMAVFGSGMIKLHVATGAGHR